MSMFVIQDSIRIHAPIDRCFLLSTSIDLVALTLGMKPVEGTTSGFIASGGRVLWCGWKFGLPQHHETLITEYQRPVFFQDSMASGRFRTFSHDHAFTEVDGRTVIHETVRFSMPFGAAGRLVGKHVLVPHIQKLIQQRFALIQRVAESDEWRRYLSEA